jgi:hypothetical protein
VAACANSAHANVATLHSMNRHSISRRSIRRRSPGSSIRAPCRSADDTMTCRVERDPTLVRVCAHSARTSFRARWPASR